MWYADDSIVSGSLQDLSQWWLNLNESGSSFIKAHQGIILMPILLVKPEHINNAKHLFHDHNLSIVTDGACVLGAPVGSSEFVTSWVTNKVHSWVKEISLLFTAFSALTHGVMSHWTIPCCAGSGYFQKSVL